MKMHEWNPQREEAVLLLHPMLSTAQMMEELLAQPLGAEYRYLIPDLSGHGEAVGEEYRSAEQEAQAIREALAARSIGRLRLAFGASLGGVVLLELLSGPGPAVDRLFFEGVSLSEDDEARCEAVKGRMLAQRRKARNAPARAAEKLGRLYGERAGRSMAEGLVSLPEERLGNMVADCSHVRLPHLGPEAQRACLFAYGERDGDLAEARRLLPERYPEAGLRVWSGHGHCTAFTEDPAAYAAMLDRWMDGIAP